VTSELLEAIPRQPRAKLEGAESIADIYAEVKALQPANKRGSSTGSGSRSGSGPNKPRPPRTDKPAYSKPHAEQPKPIGSADAANAEPSSRKPRRPRRKPVDWTQQSPAPAAVANTNNSKPSAIKRLGSQIKSWFSSSKS
jgi:hypothetical protein